MVLKYSVTNQFMSVNRRMERGMDLEHGKDQMAYITKENGKKI